MTPFEIFIAFYVIASLAANSAAYIAIGNGRFITPKDIYNYVDDFNWFGATLGWIIVSLLSPVCSFICFIRWLCTARRK